MCPVPAPLQPADSVPTQTPALVEVGISSWPSLGDAKQPLRKKDRPTSSPVRDVVALGLQ